MSRRRPDVLGSTLFARFLIAFKIIIHICFHKPIFSAWTSLRDWRIFSIGFSIWVLERWVHRLLPESLAGLLQHSEDCKEVRLVL